MRLIRNCRCNQIWVFVCLVILAVGCSQKPVPDTGDSEADSTPSTAITAKDQDAATNVGDNGPAPAGRETPRKIAEWILSINGRVMLEGSDQWIEKIDDLPPDDQITVSKVWLWEKEGGADPIQPDNILAIAKLTDLKELTLRGQKIGDSMTHVLTDLKKLEVLNLHACDITDESFPSFAKMKQLRVLDVGYSHRKITDKGVANLSELRELEELCLFASAITDNSLEVLGNLPRLKSVEVKSTDVTDDGVENLKSRVPDLKVGR